VRQGLQHLLILAVTLGALELVLRAANLRELREGYEPGHTVVHRHDPELGWRPIPNTLAAATGARPITIRHNSLGLRDLEHERTDRPTILFVGDSFVWGYDVEAEERFTDRLRGELPGNAIVNIGVPGYGTDQEYLLLQRVWDKFRPSAVVLIFCVANDREDNSSNRRYGGYYKPYLAQTDAGAWRFLGQPVPRSRHAYFTDNAVVNRSWLARLAVAGYIHVRHPEVNVPDPTERLIMMMREFVETRGAKFLVGVQYHYDPLKVVPFQKLKAFLQAQGIGYVSLEGADKYEDYANHWTPKGHALVAERVKALLTAEGVVK
jgi:hypothetical protein